MATYPSRVEVGETMIDTTTRKTLRVVRLVGSNQAEIEEVGSTSGAVSEIIDVSYLVRGIASGAIKRIG